MASFCFSSLGPLNTVRCICPSFATAGKGSFCSAIKLVVAYLKKSFKSFFFFLASFCRMFEKQKVNFYGSAKLFWFTIRLSPNSRCSVAQSVLLNKAVWRLLSIPEASRLGTAWIPTANFFPSTTKWGSLAFPGCVQSSCWPVLTLLCPGSVWKSSGWPKQSCYRGRSIAG